MISAADWDAYNAAVSGMADGMAKRAELLILAWMADNPDASVAEVREAAKSIMEGIAQVADEAAATLAAEWYDERARASGVALESAVTAAVYSADDVDRAARYQAKKLAEGDKAGFARRCGEFVRNDALKSLNETIVANVGRDSDRGARFARVMTGAENCAFCLMLAGRGAVYHTRETAGEFRRFHRGCDCKVVPSFSDDPMETLVEGRDPKDAYRIYSRIEKAESLTCKTHAVPKDEIVRSCRRFDSMLKKEWRRYSHDKIGSDSYRSGYAKVVEEAAVDAPVSIEDFTKIEGKELQISSWLSSYGFSVNLRNADDSDRRDPGNTSDAYIDDELWEFKRIESSNLSKMTKRITEKLPRQGPNFVVDLSLSAIGMDEASLKIASLLDDPFVRQVMIIKPGLLRILKK